MVFSVGYCNYTCIRQYYCGLSVGYCSNVGDDVTYLRFLKELTLWLASVQKIISKDLTEASFDAHNNQTHFLPLLDSYVN